MRAHNHLKGMHYGAVGGMCAVNKHFGIDTVVVPVIAVAVVPGVVKSNNKATLQVATTIYNSFLAIY